MINIMWFEVIIWVMTMINILVMCILIEYSRKRFSLNDSLTSLFILHFSITSVCIWSMVSLEWVLTLWVDSVNSILDFTLIPLTCVNITLTCILVWYFSGRYLLNNVIKGLFIFHFIITSVCLWVMILSGLVFAMSNGPGNPISFAFIIILTACLNIISWYMSMWYYHNHYLLNYVLNGFYMLHLIIMSVYLLVICLSEFILIILDYDLSVEVGLQIKNILVEFLMNPWEAKPNLIRDIQDTLYNEELGGGTATACKLAEILEFFQTVDSHNVNSIIYVMLNNTLSGMCEPVFCLIDISSGINGFAKEEDIRDSILNIVNPTIEFCHTIIVNVVVINCIINQDDWNSLLNFQKFWAIYICLWNVWLTCTFL